jgi:flagellar hook-associated protein 3 FlgL
MRVTQAGIYRTFLNNIANLNESMTEVSQEIASGKKLVHLSDSPSGSAELLNANAELAQIDQYKSNSDSASFFLNVTDSVLSSLHNVLTSIYVSGSQAASNIISPDERASLTQQVRSLRDQVLSLANTQARDRHIFAGSAVNSVPFSIAGDTVTYQGDTEINKINIDDGMQVQQNVDGSAVFKPVFDTINGLLAGLDSSDQTAIQAALSQFASTMNTVNHARSQVGVDLSRLEDAKTGQSTRKTIVETRQSTLGDVDAAQAAMQLTQIQTALKAALTAEGIVQQHSLFDYIS